MSTNHRPGCQRPGWITENTRRVIVARCADCGAVELRTEPVTCELDPFFTNADGTTPPGVIVCMPDVFSTRLRNPDVVRDIATEEGAAMTPRGVVRRPDRKNPPTPKEEHHD